MTRSGPDTATSYTSSAAPGKAARDPVSMQHNYNAEVEGFMQHTAAPPHPQGASHSNDQSLEVPWQQAYHQQADSAPRADAMHQFAGFSQQQQQEPQQPPTRASLGPEYVPVSDRLQSLESEAKLLRHQLIQARTSSFLLPD